LSPGPQIARAGWLGHPSCRRSAVHAPQESSGCHVQPALPWRGQEGQRDAAVDPDRWRVPDGHACSRHQIEQTAGPGRVAAACKPIDELAPGAPVASSTEGRANRRAVHSGGTIGPGLRTGHSLCQPAGDVLVKHTGNERLIRHPFLHRLDLNVPKVASGQSDVDSLILGRGGARGFSNSRQLFLCRHGNQRARLECRENFLFLFVELHCPAPCN